ncbi:MAG: hypothetical protein J0L60_03315 [Ignavibacteria bacterium]|nr:hypothetical protein [Ignavibacteria bacterium]
MRFFKFRRYSCFIPTLVLAIFLFSFFHSELGLFNYDHGNHSEHDHCEIVQVTNTAGVSFKLTHPKLEINEYLSVTINSGNRACDFRKQTGVESNFSVDNPSSLSACIRNRALLI